MKISSMCRWYTYTVITRQAGRPHRWWTGREMLREEKEEGHEGRWEGYGGRSGPPSLPSQSLPPCPPCLPSPAVPLPPYVQRSVLSPQPTVLTISNIDVRDGLDAEVRSTVREYQCVAACGVVQRAEYAVFIDFPSVRGQVCRIRIVLCFIAQSRLYSGRCSWSKLTSLFVEEHLGYRDRDRR